METKDQEKRTENYSAKINDNNQNSKPSFKKLNLERLKELELRRGGGGRTIGRK